MSAATFDRRELIVGAGAAIAAACMPVALGIEATTAGTGAPRAMLTDWDVDDMWGVYPRPHEAIGYGRPRGDGELVAAVGAADLAFVCA